MEKFGGAPENKWKGQGDVMEAAIGEEELKYAAEKAGDLELAPINGTEREVVHEADPFAPSTEIKKTAEQVLNGTPDDNIFIIQERPDRLQTFAVETTVPIAKANYDTPPVTKVTEDPRFNHVGKNIDVTNRITPRTPVVEKKSLLKRLFGQ